jgi:hypothetical protein
MLARSSASNGHLLGALDGGWASRVNECLSEGIVAIERRRSTAPFLAHPRGGSLTGALGGEREQRQRLGQEGRLEAMAQGAAQVGAPSRRLRLESACDASGVEC